MDKTPFVAREHELQLLTDQWKQERARMMILYGRRRVGKTRLITHWIEINMPRALYWVAEPTSSLDQLRSFSQTIYNFENPGGAPDSFTYANWTQALEQIARLAREERLCLVLDEFTYLLAVEPGIAGTFQNAWDHQLSQSNLFLILSGSHIGMMQRELLSYQAPLYGRTTSRVLLPPLPFKATREFFPRYRPDERVAVYAMLGGVPAYWELFEPGVGLDRNIRSQFLSGINLFHDEPRLLLQDFVSEIHNYVAILRALAYGYRTPKEIAGFTGLNDRHLSMYLTNLVATGFVERRVPVTQGQSSRLGRHFIVDPFMRFYFRFLSQRQVQLALGVHEQALAEIKKHLIDFIGANTWEELCREWLLRAGASGRLPFMPDQVGSAWTRKAQIDVVGINRMEKTLILGECKWDRHPIGVDVLKGLIQKTDEIVPKEGEWKVFHLGFARTGWSNAAIEYAAQVSRTNQEGGNWLGIGMELLDLGKVDDDLGKWN
ncbi:MAG: ATP-binding protein [Anaerolineales bacterium]|nr:ATP-binding protein [Anaerolineales bacterium]